MIGVSAGTASLLGLSGAKCETLPNMAYLMLGNNCSNSCKFCPQRKNDHGRKSFISRISWPLFDDYAIISQLKKAYEQRKIKRACFQIVNSQGVIERFRKIMTELKTVSDIPVGISTNILSRKTAENLFIGGLKNLAIPLDAATPEIFCKIKGSINSWNKSMKLLQWASSEYPGQVATHLISGLGETEEDMINMMKYLYSNKIRVGLFAFTPVKGTPLSMAPPPEISSYRRLQAAHHLIKHNVDWVFKFKKGNLFFGEDLHDLIPLINDGSPFETSGCDGCNRPYYNERPGGILYNYPRKLDADEVKEAIRLLDGNL